jgi:RecA/RadA recombinase
MLCGGLRAGTVYDVYGGAGAGKSQLCMQLAANAARTTAGNRAVVFVLTYDKKSPVQFLNIWDRCQFG